MRTKVRAATAIGLNVVNRVGWYFGMRPIITRSPKDKEPRQAIVLPRLKYANTARILAALAASKIAFGLDTGSILANSRLNLSFRASRQSSVSGLTVFEVDIGCIELDMSHATCSLWPTDGPAAPARGPSRPSARRTPGRWPPAVQRPGMRWTSVREWRACNGGRTQAKSGL